MSDICVLNLSKRLKPEEVVTMVDAVSRQQAEDVCRLWGVEYRAINVYSSVDELPPLSTDIVPIVDEPGEAGVLGFHSIGIAPFGRVFVNPVLDNGGCVLHDPNDPQRLSLASVFSHECGVELPIDPNCDQYAIDAMGNEWDLESGDPVQRNQYTKIAKMPWGDVPVSVSDFVTPDFFKVGSQGPWNFLTSMPLPGPFTIAPGGYAMMNGQPVFARRADGTVIHPPAWYLAMKPPGARRSRRLASRTLWNDPKLRFTGNKP